MKTQTSLVAWWSELLTTNHEVPGSIPGSAVGIFPCRGRSPQRSWSGNLVEVRFKAPPGTQRSHSSSLTSSGQRNRALWASQPQKSVTLRPQPGAGTTKSIWTCGGIGEEDENLMRLPVSPRPLPPYHVTLFPQNIRHRQPRNFQTISKLTYNSFCKILHPFEMSTIVFNLPVLYGHVPWILEIKGSFYR
jgi:hypothetical protein